MAAFRVTMSFPGGEPGEVLTAEQIRAKAANADLAWLCDTGVLVPLGGASGTMRGEPDGAKRLAAENDALSERVKHLEAKLAEHGIEPDAPAKPKAAPEDAKAKAETAADPADGGRKRK